MQILRGRGILKSQSFKGKYEAELKFPEGWGWVLEFPIKQTFHKSAQSMRAVNKFLVKKSLGCVDPFFSLSLIPSCQCGRPSISVRNLMSKHFAQKLS